MVKLLILCGFLLLIEGCVVVPAGRPINGLMVVPTGVYAPRFYTEPPIYRPRMFMYQGPRSRYVR